MAEDSFPGQPWILHWLKPAEELHPCFSIISDRWLFKNHAFILHMSVSKWHLQYNKSITDRQAWSTDAGFCATSCLPQFLDTYVNLISYFLLFILKYYYHFQALQQPIMLFFKCISQLDEHYHFESLFKAAVSRSQKLHCMKITHTV